LHFTNEIVGISPGRTVLSTSAAGDAFAQDIGLVAIHEFLKFGHGFIFAISYIETLL